MNEEELREYLIEKVNINDEYKLNYLMDRINSEEIQDYLEPEHIEHINSLTQEKEDFMFKLQFNRFNLIEKKDVKNSWSNDFREYKFSEINIKKIFKIIRDNKVTLLRGSTGCGKSTTIPLKLMSEYKKIVCTQPRKISTINLAKRVSVLNKTNLGYEVGYAVRFEKKITNKTKLKYVTDGLFIREIVNSNSNLNVINSYDLIIIDEAHERSVNIDLLLGFINTNIKRIKSKVLIMSATLESIKLVNYFKCPLITIKTQKFEVEEHYLDEPVNDNYQMTIDTILDILPKYKNGNILVFMSGANEINKAVDECNSYLEGSNIKVFPLYGNLDFKNQREIIENKNRKVILATNIAETALTINNIRFVIDCGYVKSLSVESETSISSLDRIRISKSQAIQRKGRAGRTCNGHVFRMYTRDEYNSFECSPEPEIFKVDLVPFILTCSSLGIVDVMNYKWVDVPKENAVQKAYDYLLTLKVIDKTGKITAYGRKIMKVPLPVQLSMSLIHSYENNCFKSVAIIAAFLESLPIFVSFKLFNDEEQAKKKIYEKFDTSGGNFYFYLDLWQSWVDNDFNIKFLEENYLRVSSFNKIKNIYDQLLKIPIFKNYKLVRDVNVSGSIEESFTYGYFFNTAVLTGSKYITPYENNECFISSKDLLVKVKPNYLIFNLMIRQNKIYIVDCLEIEIDDLMKVFKKFN
ncbi:CDC28 [Hepatospora eriocheir]|uniref:CDC28 n=1 Tax=Hepatospora eriocheir TaxID=1081669 RepID=A0A1X0Q993_9MICR|nr:CDC28 [Hepatospora eriocheir]